MLLVEDFHEYQIMAMASGYKYEKWGSVILKRPDPQIIWQDQVNIKVDATYQRSDTGGGSWQNASAPDTWQIHYQDLVFNLKLMNFKHTGLFPEQAYNWCLLREKIAASKSDIKVLNLFAYTGAASIAALKAGASVVHVDASHGMVAWAKENVQANHLTTAPIRFMVDDVKKFVKREMRRGNKYDIIIMDPPSFGRGSKNEVWQLENDLFPLVQDAASLLSDKALMFIINTYSTGLSKTVLDNILTLSIKQPGKIISDELGLKAANNLILPCGLTARWERSEKGSA